jgi:hypothetical protein
MNPNMRSTQDKRFNPLDAVYRGGSNMHEAGESFPARLSPYTPNIRISRSDFLSGISTQMANFLKIIPFLRGEGQDRTKYSRRFYEYVTSQAKLAEEFLDICGAKENRAWFFLRELVATIYSFAKVAYLLRYLEFPTSPYEFFDDETVEFQVISSNVRTIFDDMLQKAFWQIESEAINLGITIPQNGVKSDDFPVFYIPGHLYVDTWVEEATKVDEAIVKIATSYLEIAEEYTALGFSRIFLPQELVELVPEHVNEERLRTFEAAVHNLQSVYDTYIQYTRMEADDRRLMKLRGCVSIALRLLEIATVLVHFHERHERNSRHPAIYQRLQEIIGTYHILDVMGNYALFYCTRFLEKGKQLSEETVMDYAQIQSKRIPIPIYRGFHVRPSTYIAKIVRHYGVEVQMLLGDEVYDASSVFDLFRANEQINMEKRRLIAQKLVSAQHLIPAHREELAQVMRRELKFLIEAQVLTVHHEILPGDMVVSELDRKDALSSEEVRGCINELITRLLALGKIDIIMPLAVTFIGDRRALHDIETLAKTGYGEDAKGNNIPLPEEISYLYR